jgi:hypothetical protein
MKSKVFDMDLLRYLNIIYMDWWACFAYCSELSLMRDLHCGMSLRGNTHRYEPVSLRNRRLLDLSVMKGGRWL